LRNQIYRYAFSDLVSFMVRQPAHWEWQRAQIGYPRSPYGWSDYDVAEEPFALIQTCHQIYQETALLPFAVMPFDLRRFTDKSISVFFDFLHGLPHAKIAAITTIKIHRHYLLPGHWQDDDLWTLKLILERLIGLKRVVITENEPCRSKTQRKSDIETAFGCMRSALGGKEVVLKLDDVYNAIPAID
jgi:hypothetical protein